MNRRPLTDARGRPVDLRLTGGQVSDLVPAAELLEGKFGAAVVADRGHDSDRVVSLVEAQGSRAVVPPRSRWSGRREFAASCTGCATGSSSASTA